MNARMQRFQGYVSMITGHLGQADRVETFRGCRDYTIDAHWALYVDNYLEGLHIPFVHPGLNRIIDYGNYSSELFRYASLQRVLAMEGEPAFDPHAGTPDLGRRVAAFYWWIFPNLMFNFYPWGLSVNVVRPERMARTRVTFRSYHRAGRRRWFDRDPARSAYRPL